MNWEGRKHGFHMPCGDLHGLGTVRGDVGLRGCRWEKEGIGYHGIHKGKQSA
jgi:hypothetical protein